MRRCLQRTIRIESRRWCLAAPGHVRHLAKRKRGHSGFLLRGSGSRGRMATCQEVFPIQEDEHLLVVLRYVERKRVAGAAGAACRAVAMVFAEGLGGRGRRCAVAPRPGASGRRLDRLGQPAAKRSGTLGLAQEHRAGHAVRRGVLAADHSRPPRAGVQPPPPRQAEAERMILYPTIEKQNVPFSHPPFPIPFSHPVYMQR